MGIPPSVRAVPIVHIGLENRVEIRCGATMLRLAAVRLNLARRPAGVGIPFSPRNLEGLLRSSALMGAALWLAACSNPSHPIVIGLSGPFSQPRGASMLRAAQLAIDQINAKGGPRGGGGGGGGLLKLTAVDDPGSENTAVRVAEQLYADPAIVAVVGHLSSDPSRAAV